MPMLRKVRITIAVLFFVLITLLLLDFSGTIHTGFGWMAEVQFLPALLAVNVGVVALLVLLTLLFGRVYCSVVCPLGVFQDIISYFSGKKTKNRFSYSPACSWLRYGMLALFVVALLAGGGFVVALLAPYSSYGRIVSNLFAPLYYGVNNLLAYGAERVGSYAFYPVDVWIKSVVTFVVAAVTFVLIAVLAWRSGRIYCNTVCPVGTVLGVLSRFSLFRPVIDADKCNGCGLCARNCKASCIDPKAHTIDSSRCVVCMDCLDKCSRHAIAYRLRRHRSATVAAVSSEHGHIDDSRRSFLSMTAWLAATPLLNAKGKVDGGLAVIEDKKIPVRATRIVPAGAGSVRNMAQHCTACQLCVSSCPNGVLRPSQRWDALMQPEMSYERGYCRPECSRCSKVCPTGAIRPITVAEKSAVQIGHAVWVKENCLPLTEGVECGNCARHCPVGAIQMVASRADMPDSPKVPVVDTERCIGCGACENLCPARPFSAIYVEGHAVHRIV